MGVNNVIITNMQPEAAAIEKGKIESLAKKGAIKNGAINIERL
jgi:hypothetical protein